MTSFDKGYLMSRAQNKRVNELFEHLREREFWTVPELALKLDVSKRTLFRDLDLLRERGVQIEAEPGRGGGLRLLAGSALKPLPLESEQSLFLLVSLALLEKLEFPFFQKGRGSIQRKVIQIFPEAQWKKLSRLKSRVFIGALASPSVRSSYGIPKPQVVSLVEAAFMNEQRLLIEYLDEKATQTQRKVEPHGLFLSWPAWYLITFDHLREAPRVFRLDRIQKAEVLETERFRERAQELFQTQVGKEFGSPL